MNAKIAILGAGKIGEALVAGLVSSKWCPPDQIVVTARSEDRLRGLTERYGVRATELNREAAADAPVVVIAVKPQDIEALLTDIHDVAHVEPDRDLDRGGDPDSPDREPLDECRARRPCDAEHAGHGPRGDGGYRRRARMRRRSTSHRPKKCRRTSAGRSACRRTTWTR